MSEFNLPESSCELEAMKKAIERKEKEVRAKETFDSLVFVLKKVNTLVENEDLKTFLLDHRDGYGPSKCTSARNALDEVLDLLETTNAARERAKMAEEERQREREIAESPIVTRDCWNCGTSGMQVHSKETHCSCGSRWS